MLLLQLLNVFLLSDTCETQSVGVCEDGYFKDNLGHVFIITAVLLVLSLPMKQRKQLIRVLNDKVMQQITEGRTEMY